MSLIDQQIDFINSATAMLQAERDELNKKGHVSIGKGVEIAITKINIMAIVEWGIDADKLGIMK